jgi:hypothetical protein
MISKTEESEVREQEKGQEPETEYPGLTQFEEVRDHVIVEPHIFTPSRSQSTMCPFSKVARGKILYRSL